MNRALKTICSLNVDSRNILGIIQKNGPITKNELIVMTKMKLTSLNRMMQPLEDRGLIVEVGTAVSTGGRKPILYDVNSGQFYVIGVDISRTYTQVVLTNLKMQILAEQKFVMTQCNTPDRTIREISNIINDVLNQLTIHKEDVLGIGLGTVGPLDRAQGVILEPRNFPAPGWVNAPVKTLLESETNLPVIIDNGANMAVLAEKLFGEGKHYENIAYFNCGIGIRTGVISSGAIVRTINDAEDAFGHMIIDVDGELCSCGNYGCIECYSSIPAVIDKFVSAVKKGRNTIVAKPVREISYMDICLASEQNDELAKETIASAATIFGAGLANYINLLNPRLVILSGTFIKHSDLFYRICKEVALKKYYAREEERIVFSNGGYFGEYAISIGAASMVVETVLQDGVYSGGYR